MELGARPGEVDLSPDCAFDRFLAHLPHGLDSLLRAPDAMVERGLINMNGSLRSDDLCVPRWSTLEQALGGAGVLMCLGEDKSWLKSLEEAEKRQHKAISRIEAQKNPILDPIRFMGRVPERRQSPNRSSASTAGPHHPHRRPLPDPAALAAARAQAQKEAEIMKKKKDAELACFQEQQRQIQEQRKAKAAARPALSQAHLKAAAQPLGRKPGPKIQALHVATTVPMKVGVKKAPLGALHPAPKKNLIRPVMKVPFKPTTEHKKPELSLESILRQVGNLSRLPEPVTPLATTLLPARGAKRPHSEEETAAPAQDLNKSSEKKRRVVKKEGKTNPLPLHLKKKAVKQKTAVHRLAKASGPLVATTTKQPSSNFASIKDVEMPNVGISSSVTKMEGGAAMSMRFKLMCQQQQVAAAR